MLREKLNELDITERFVMLVLTLVSVPFSGYPMEVPCNEVLSESGLDDSTFNQVVESLRKKGKVFISQKTGNFEITGVIRETREEMWERIFRLTTSF